MVSIRARTFTFTLLLPIPCAKAISKTGTATNCNVSTELDYVPWERRRPAGMDETRRRDAGAPRFINFC